MKSFGSLSVFILLLLTCNTPKKGDKDSKTALETTAIETGKDVEVDFPVYDYEGIAPLLNKKNDTTYIINFWATWCKPCIEELPYFERTFAERGQEKVAMILVSLDMPSMWKKRLEPFVENQGLKGEVVILDDPKMNDWIPKIDKDWQGGIPATLIYNRNMRTFYPHGFTYEELNTELNKFIK